MLETTGEITDWAQFQHTDRSSFIIQRFTMVGTMAWQQASLEGSSEKAGASGIAVYMLEKDGCMR